MAHLALKGGSPAVEGLSTAWPVPSRQDIQAVAEAVRGGKWCRLKGGSAVDSFERAFAEFQEAEYAVAVANGTVGLELCLKAAGIGPGDEVIVPAVSFIATASAVTELGAVPVFADIDPDTGCLDAEGLQIVVSASTRAVLAVHYGGYPVDFDCILQFTNDRGLTLICDAAHAHGTQWRGKRVGSLAEMSSYSFQESKQLCSGEGGAVVLTDRSLHERARLIHNIGRSPTSSSYVHHLLSSNYRLTELQGALLLSRLAAFEGQLRTRHENGAYLREELRRIPGIGSLKEDERITTRDCYFVVLQYEPEEFRGLPKDRFLEALQAEGVPCSAAYGFPLYRNPAFLARNLTDLARAANRELPQYEELRLPAAESFCRRQFVIPHQVLLNDRSKLEMIAVAVAKVRTYSSELVDDAAAV